MLVTYILVLHAFESSYLTLLLFSILPTLFRLKLVEHATKRKPSTLSFRVFSIIHLVNFNAKDTVIVDDNDEEDLDYYHYDEESQGWHHDDHRHDEDIDNFEKDHMTTTNITMNSMTYCKRMIRI